MYPRGVALRRVTDSPHTSSWLNDKEEEREEKESDKPEKSDLEIELLDYFFFLLIWLKSNFEKVIIKSNFEQEFVSCIC